MQKLYVYWIDIALNTISSGSTINLDAQPWNEVLLSSYISLDVSYAVLTS